MRSPGSKAQREPTESRGGLEQQERTEPKTSSIRDPRSYWPWPTIHSHLRSPELSLFVNTVLPDVLLEWSSPWGPSENAPDLANSLTLLSSSLTTPGASSWLGLKYHTQPILPVLSSVPNFTLSKPAQLLTLTSWWAPGPSPDPS